MKNAIILHGKPSKEEYFSDAPSPSNHHWLPWLQKQFLMAGYLAETPEMPDPYQPDYQAWKTAFERQPLGPQTVMVGHSCGGGFLLRYLTENPQPVSRVVLVAPWLDPNRQYGCLYNFSIDRTLSDRTDLHVIHSDNDSENVMKSIDIIRAALPSAHYHLFPGLGHFCLGDLGGPAFPALGRLAVTGAPSAPSLR